MADSFDFTNPLRGLDEELEKEFENKLREVLENPKEMDIIIVDIKGMKHSMNLTNITIQNAIIPSAMKLFFEQNPEQDVEALKAKPKFELIKSHSTTFVPILLDFVSKDEDKENIIH